MKIISNIVYELTWSSGI